jgi:transketolase
MRDAFVRKLTEKAAEDPSIMLLVGDLGFGVVADFGEAYPRQFLNCGVAEQSMVGVAAGMASAGRRPFVYSIANFPTVRPLEQIRNDVCYHGLGVTIVSVGAGLAYGSLGYTHHAVEDISILRSLPGMRVYSPADAMECRAAVDEILADPSPAYLRLGKNKEPLMHEAPPDLSHGEPVVVREGTDVTVLVAGPVIVQAIEVADLLAEDGLSVRVVSCPVIKPLNAEAVRAAAEGTVGIVTLEEHTIMGGFGSAVLEAFAVRGWRTAILPLGLDDAATHIIGSQEWLRERAGLSTPYVRKRVAEFARGAA